MSEKRSFSLLSLFLIITLAAAIAGMLVFRNQAIVARRMAEEAMQEVDEIRARFGDIQIKDPDKTYFAKLKSYEGEDTYRAVFPSGSRYLLHISDTPMKHSKIPDDLIPTKTMSMNGWREGADVILKWSVWGDDPPRFVVNTQTDELFNYELKDWNPGNHPNEGFDLGADSQVEFATDEKVILSYFGNEKLERGIVFWLEPHAMWEARRAKSK